MRGVSDGYQGGSSADNGELDIGSVGRAIVHRKLWVIGSTLGCLACAAVFVTLATPRYTAETKVIVENQESYFTRPSGPVQVDQQTQGIDPEAVASQIQLVMSRDLARSAIKALDLKGNPDFDPTANGPGLMARLGSLIGAGGRAISPDDRLLETYFEQLNVSSVVKSRVIQIEFSSRNPDLAAKAANKVADLYIAVQADAKRESARAAAASLGELIATLRDKVSQAESKAEAFRANAGITMGANNITISGQQLADLNAQLTLAKAARAESQAKARMLREQLRQGRLGDVSDVGNNELIRRLSEQRATLRSQIASESRTLLPGHPRIKELSAQLSELDGEIRLTVERTARALENDAQVASARVDNLQTAINQQKRDVGGASGDEAKARELDREARLLKDQLESSVTKYQEALARENSESTPGDARIISRAVAPPLPSFPKKVPILAFSGVAGLILSIGALISAELMSGRAYAPAAPVEGAEPDVGVDEQPAAPRRAVVDDAVGAPARPRRMSRRDRAPAEPDALADLATRLAGSPSSDFARRILVTTESGEVSARAIAATLGRSLARDRQAILVELAPESPARDDRLGLSDLISGAATFEDAIHRELQSRLHVLPAGRSRVVHDDDCELILDALSRTYDFVILAAAPLADDDLALAIAPDADVAILACKAEPDSVAMQELALAGAGEILSYVAPSTATGRTAA